MLGLLAVASTGALAGCDPAPPNPILLVGGHTNQLEDLQGFADYLGDQLPHPEYDDPAWTAGVELASAPGKDFPFDTGHTDWPGSAASAASEAAILDAINDLYAAAGNTPIDIVAVSQGAPTTRALLQRNPDNVRSKVAGHISFSGVNAGVPASNLIATLGCLFYDLPVCDEIVFPANPDRPGQTDWLVNSVNKPSGTGPTPGADTIDYYHVYTAIDQDGATTHLGEGAQPYQWSAPLLGATNRSAQQACPSNPDRRAPHGGWYADDDGDPYMDTVMEELLLDALNRTTLSVPVAECVDQVDPD